jgi:aldose 1-epimerase
VGDAIEGLDLRLPARERVVVDDRKLPTGTEPVSGEDDFTSPRRIGDLEIDAGFGALVREEGRATATLVDPATGRGVALWVDEHHQWLQVFTPPADGPRPGIAIEPMTAPADAFNSGTDLVTLAPAGSPGDELSVSWGIQVI